jgi:hypothetical protein
MSKKPVETVVETTHTATVEAVVEDTSTELGASATVLMKKGNRLLLGKVNQEGSDVFDFFDDDVWDMDFNTIWTEYLNWRLSDKSSAFIDREITSALPGGVGGELEKGSFVRLFSFSPSAFRQAVDMLEDVARKISPADEVLTQYDDLEVFVDFDKKEVSNITKTSAEYTAEQHARDARLLSSKCLESDFEPDDDSQFWNSEFTKSLRDDFDWEPEPDPKFLDDVPNAWPKGPTSELDGELLDDYDLDDDDLDALVDAAQARRRSRRLRRHL